jgi:hypothetical protein
LLTIIFMQKEEKTPLVHRSPSPQEETFTPQTRNNPIGPVSTVDTEPADNEHLGDAKASTFNPASSTGSVKDTVTSAATAVSNAVPTSYEDLKAQLAQAQATIALYGQEGGLRMRKVVGATGDSTTLTTDVGARQATSEGVPVQIVALLCLLSFLLAYLFF